MNEIKVLDKGFIRLEAFTGGDESVIRSARVSYGPKPPDAEKDKKLISFMISSEHGTPFEHNLFTFHVKAPIFVFRQWHRTRIGVSYNELSARYSEMKDDFYIPKNWRAQEKGPKANKQGSVEADLDHAACTDTLIASSEQSMIHYRYLLEKGVAREMARMVLPVNLYSEMYCTMNARSLMNFIALRSDGHAQWETRQYSHAMAHFLEDKMPWTAEVFFEFLQMRKNRNYSEMFYQIAPTIPSSEVAA